MPSLRFYAANADHDAIVDFVLRETSCAVFELSSEPSRKLRQFKSSPLPRRARWPLLELWSTNANSRPRIKRETFTTDARTWWRESLDGLGVIQLYLEGVRGRSLVPSSTGHNSLKRATTWAMTKRDRLALAQWDFDEVTRESARINRFIQSLAVNTFGKLAVLPAADELFRVGVEPSR